jgi:DNA-binding transcriptional regulator YhcF (GntR family)
MDLKVNRQSELPLHVQLKAQVKHLIRAGHLVPGAQMPTVRQLAGFLRINRNTVARVFQDLEAEGLLSGQRGRGTFVAGRAPRDERARRLSRMLDRLLVQAAREGLGPSEVAAALFAQAPLPAGAPAPDRPRLPAIFTECNVPQLQQFSREVTEAVPLETTPLLIPDLKARLRREPAFLDQYALVVTTFFHVHEVQRLLRGHPIEVIALLAEANLSTLNRLAALPEGTKVGLACSSWAGTRNIRTSVENAGLTNIRPVLGSAGDARSLRKVLRETRVLVCSGMAEAAVRRLAPRGTEIIVDDRTLDKGGLEMLRGVVDRLQREGRGAGGGRLRPGRGRRPRAGGRRARPG